MAVVAAAFAAGFAISLSGGSEETGGAVGSIIGLVGGVLSAFAVVKRLHDLDRPGSHFWLFFIPFYNIYLGLLLLFKSGTDGESRYGPDPLTQ